MNNYEYIIACLPVLRQGGASDAGLDADAVLDEIRSQLSERDRRLLDLMLRGYDAETLDASFYEEVLHCPSRFLRAYFRFDLGVRNTRTEFLNRALGRPEGTDLVRIDEKEFEDAPRIEAVLSDSDILARERGLDDIMWEKAEELTQGDLFDLDAILGFVARLKTVDRWLRLDPETGRALFRRLVDELRSGADMQKDLEG